MTARIIAVINEKGGVGKTTVAMELSATLAQRCYGVMVADCDAQASASAWSRAAPEDTPFPAAVVNLASLGEKLHIEIHKHIHHYDFIVLDCPPSIENMSNHSALLIANLAIVPVGASPTDYWSLFGLKTLVTGAIRVNQGLKSVILPNRLMRTSLNSAILTNLDSFGIPVLTSRLSNRVAFQEAAISGVSLTRLGRSAAAAAHEVDAFCTEILDVLRDTPHD